MSRGFRAVSSRLEGKVYETRFTEAQGIQGPEGLAERRAPSAERRAPSAERRAPSAERPDSVQSQPGLLNLRRPPGAAFLPALPTVPCMAVPAPFSALWTAARPVGPTRGPAAADLHPTASGSRCPASGQRKAPRLGRMPEAGVLSRLSGMSGGPAHPHPRLEHPARGPWTHRRPADGRRPGPAPRPRSPETSLKRRER